MHREIILAENKCMQRESPAKHAVRVHCQRMHSLAAVRDGLISSIVLLGRADGVIAAAVEIGDVVVLMPFVVIAADDGFNKAVNREEGRRGVLECVVIVDCRKVV